MKKVSALAGADLILHEPGLAGRGLVTPELYRGDETLLTLRYREEN